MDLEGAAFESGDENTHKPFKGLKCRNKEFKTRTIRRRKERPKTPKFAAPQQMRFS
jgi:hypothetical protein